jgi:L-ascorbate metabolism protein UlaG (beta-lactamase superfamily)
MPTNLIWFGHNAWSIDTAGKTLLVDPFLDDSPTAPVKSDEVKADFNHFGDTIKIAQRTGASVLTNFEVGEWLKAQGLAEDKVTGMNPGGGIHLPFGHAKFTIAHHSSSLPDGSYGGVPGGWLLTLDGARIYFACDTALFLDMKLIGSGGLDLAVLPIGDLYTMGPDDSIDAIKFLNPKRVAPCHYNTWPPIEQDAQAWAQNVRSHTAAEPIVLSPGEKFRLG